MEKTVLSQLTAINLVTWDERAAIHLRDSTGFYAVERFKQGEDILLPIESDEIGEVSEKHLLHLQCHIGLEALCLARRGALVTGLDFSSVSIAAARTLAQETNISAHFVESDVYDADKVLKGKKFNIVYVSWGSLNWLPDIGSWGRVVANLLAPGGYLYLIEQHPFIATMKACAGVIRPSYSFRTPLKQPIISEVPSSYNEDSASLLHTRIHEWNHPLSDIVMALLNAGLKLSFLHEHEVIAWKRMPVMVPAGKRLFRLPHDQVSMPLSFSLKAEKL